MTDDKSREQHGACLPTAAGRGRLRAYEGGYIRGLSFCASLRLLRIASRSQHAAICHLSSVIRFAFGYRLLAIREARLLRTTSRSQHASICHLSFVICHSLRSWLSAIGYWLFAKRCYWLFAKRMNPSDDPPGLSTRAVNRLIKPWFSFAVVGLFVFASFYTLKLAENLFLPMVLAGFLGFLLTPVTRGLRKIGLSEFWAPLVGTLGFLAILLSLLAALWLSLAQFQPDFPQYLDHIQKRLAPIIDSVRKNTA